MVSHSSICSSTSPKDFLSKALRAALRPDQEQSQERGASCPLPCAHKPPVKK